MKWPKATAALTCAVMMVTLLGILIWQQTRIERLKAEAEILRRQVALAPSLTDQSDPPTSPQPGPTPPPISEPQPPSNQSLSEDQSRELLRLRGQVGILRGELAEAVKSGLKEGALQPPTGVNETSKPTQEEVEDAERASAITQEKVANAKQVLDVLATALKVPQSVAQIEGTDIVDVLKDPSLAPYQVYLRFKVECFALGRQADAERARAEGARAALQAAAPHNSRL